MPFASTGTVTVSPAGGCASPAKVWRRTSIHASTNAWYSLAGEASRGAAGPESVPSTRSKRSPAARSPSAGRRPSLVLRRLDRASPSVFRAGRWLSNLTPRQPVPLYEVPYAVLEYDRNPPEESA